MHFARIVRAGLLVPATLVTVGLATSPGATGAAVGCDVDYTITNQWQGGFGTNITATNFGDPMSSWTLEWTFAAGQRVTAEAWNGAYTQTGSTVRVRNVSYNGTVPTGGSVTLGFNGTWSGSNPVPKSFKLNGVPCTGLPTTTTVAPAPAPAPPAPPATTTEAFAPTTTTTEAPPPPATSSTTTEPTPTETTPGTFHWPTTKPKTVVVLSADRENLDAGGGSVLARWVIGLLLLTGGVVLLLELCRRVLRG
ncbi:cellulose-binding domain-containing protein [Saccharothrix deserti]|uniref:cellulose-binding domain-containing protein n=1 Tax=Saccharothrix deserti TaxID=2593674 RepID=UPI00131B3590|nr:cellulose-binding domain-containing protein [Saccharothrix deserti]